MTVIVTVHGTSAGDPSDEGPKWWQRNSNFQKRLATWLDFPKAHARVEPFHWGVGPNSETARRAAGNALLKRIRQLERSGEDYVLIGHSHGGSVIHHALVEAAGRKIALPHLKQWITIATPFIAMRPLTFTVRRLGHVGKVAYIFMMASIVSVFTILPMYYFYGKAYMRLTMEAQGQKLDEAVVKAGFLDVWTAGIMATLVLTPLMLYFVMHWAQRAMRRRHARTTDRFFAEHFAGRWHSLRSREDEAINALRAALPLKISLFKRNILTEATQNLVVFAMIAFYSFFMIWQIYLIFKLGYSSTYFNELNSIYPEAIREFMKMPDFGDLSKDPIDVSRVWQFITAQPAITLGAIGGFFIVGPLTIAIMWLMIWILLAVIRLVACVVGIPTAWGLNALTAGRLKNNAFGNDAIGEYVASISTMPGGCENECGVVPDEIEAALRSHVEGNAALALARARKVLGLSSELAQRDDIAKVLGEQLTGGELIHTAYFDVDAFAKLVAAALHGSGVLDFSDGFRKTENCEALVQCFMQTRLPAERPIRPRS